MRSDFEKLQILIADLEFGIGAESGDQGSLVAGVFALFADADRGFEDEENIVAAFLNAGNDIGDVLGSDSDPLIASPSSFMSCFSC